MGTDADLNEVSLFDVLSAPTAAKSNNSTPDPVNEADFNLEFEKPVHDVLDDPIEDDYDAEAEAEKLINLIDVGNTIVLSPIAGFKMNRSRGGKAAFNKMRDAFMKKNAGKKLTESEEELLTAFENYKRDLQLLNGEIPFSKQQKEILMKLAVPMCESTRFKANDKMAFWVMLGGYEIQKIIKIIQA